MDVGVRSWIDWTPAQSSMVARYRYDAISQRLYVEFHSGAVGYYSNVSQYLVQEFSAAPSLGTFVARRFRNQMAHPWTRLDSHQTNAR